MKEAVSCHPSIKILRFSQPALLNQIGQHQLLYVLTSKWVLRNMPFQCFSDKKLKKEEKARKLKQNFFEIASMKGSIQSYFMKQNNCFYILAPSFSISQKVFHQNAGWDIKVT